MSNLFVASHPNHDSFWFVDDKCIVCLIEIMEDSEVHEVRDVLLVEISEVLEVRDVSFIELSEVLEVGGIAHRRLRYIR